MKVFLSILAIMFFIIPAHNLRAQETHSPSLYDNIPYSLCDIKFGSANYAKKVQSPLYPQSGEQNLSLVERMITQQKDVSDAFLNKQAQRNLGPNKTAAPNSQIYLPDSLTLYAMSDTLRMSASYNQKGWNNQILVQVWLSGYWVNYTQTSWTYLDSNASNLTLKQTWLNGQWTNSTLDSSTYDAHGHMLVHLFKYWYQGAWKDSILSSRTYDVNGNMLTNVGWYKINNQWTNHDRSTYTYDGGGNVLTYLFESAVSSQWVNSDLSIYTYDGNGHMLSQVNQYWQGGQWINSYQDAYTYDANGHILTMLRQVWNGQWNNAALSTYTYDANGNMLSYLSQISANGQWTNSTIHTYTYDANGKMLTDWLKGWTNGAWMNGSLYTYTYDANRNMVNELLQYWLNGQWTNYQQSAFTYDANGNELTGNNTMWSGSSWVPTDNNFPLAVNGATFNFTGYRIIISYIPANTTDVSGETSNIVSGYSLSQNYPNPFNPATKIEYALSAQSHVILKIYNMLGQLVQTLVDQDQSAGVKSIAWNAEKLPSGVYFYRLEAMNKSNSTLSFHQDKKMLLVK
ncbi:MAG: T9SS type A sorting domain-containing protein [Bacteroidota bacterium]